MTEDSASAEEAAAQRRERLKALRVAQELLTDESPQPQHDPKHHEEEKDQEKANAEISQHQHQEEQNGKQDMKFRNYFPKDKELQQNRIAPPTLPKFDDPAATAPSMADVTKDPIVHIAPKKANWDLRRDVQKRLEKLERRTQRAIIELMQEEEKRRQETADEDNTLEEEH